MPVKVSYMSVGCEDGTEWKSTVQYCRAGVRERYSGKDPVLLKKPDKPKFGQQLSECACYFLLTDLTRKVER